MTSTDDDAAAHPAVQLHLRIRQAVQAILQREGYALPTAFAVAQHAATEAEGFLWQVLNDWQAQPVGGEDPFA